MVSAIKQFGIVGKEGKVEVSANLPEGTKVEIIILVATPDETPDKTQDETEYLLSTTTNRKYLLEAVSQIKNHQDYIYVDLDVDQGADLESL